MTMNKDPKGVTNENIVKLLYANRQLQNLTILLCHQISLNKLLDMISGNRFIKNLKICKGIADLSEIELNRLVAKYPLMVELEFWDCFFTADAAITLIHQLNSLKRFNFEASDQFEFDRFLNQLDKQWQHDVLNYQGHFMVNLTR